MALEIYLILTIIVAVVIYLVAPKVVGAYLRYQGKRIITCAVGSSCGK